MDNSILTVLKNLGWTEGFRIPVANDENKTLESNVENCLKTGIKLSSHLKNCTDNWNNMNYYFNTVLEERHHNEETYLAYTKHRDTENELLTRIKNQLETLKTKKADILKSNKKILQENTHLQITYEKIHGNVENLKKNIDWSEELEQLWIDHTNEGNENINIIEKYNTQNIAQFEKLDIKRRQLISEKEEYDDILGRKYKELNEIHCALQNLAKLSHKTREERLWLIEQWESSTKALKMRDIDIQNTLQEMTILSQVIRNAENKTLEQKIFYEEQLRNNTETIIETHHKQAKLNKKQTAKENLNQNVETLNYEVTDLQRKLSSLGVEISQKRTFNTKLKKLIDKETDTMNHLISANDNLKKKRKITESRSDSINDRIKQLNKIFQEEQHKLNLLNHNFKSLEQRWQQIKFTSEDANEKLIICDSELRQLMRIKISVTATINERKGEIERLLNILMDVKTRENQITSRIEYLKGEKTNEEAADHKKVLTELTQAYQKNCETLEKTNSELVSFKNQITKLKKVIVDFAGKINKLASKKENLLSDIDSGEKLLTKIKEENVQKTVTENIIRLRAQNLENALSKGMDKIYTLKKQNIELDTVLRKHDLEIHTASELLKMKKKTTFREISNIKKNIEQIRKRIEQNMKKYEIIVDTSGKNENGQPPSISDYKIRIVKERCALLEKGDILDERIRIMEKEIRAMENTLTLVNVTNDSYKQHIYAIDKNSDESIKYEQLKNEKVRLLTTIKNNKNMFADLKSEITNLNTSLSSSKLQNQMVSQSKQNKEQDFKQLQSLMEQQQFKFNRVQNKLKRFRKLLQSNQTGTNFYECEFLAKELQNTNKSVLQRITQLINDHEDIRDVLYERLSAKGITLPDQVTTKLKEFASSGKTVISNDSSFLMDNLKLNPENIDDYKMT